MTWKSKVILRKRVREGISTHFKIGIIFETPGKIIWILVHGIVFVECEGSADIEVSGQR
jgi:hypothetical protein